MTSSTTTTDAVAEIIGTSQDNARQLASRARRHVQDEAPRFDASAEEREQLADTFLAAAQNGDFEALEALLAEDVELHGDGGGSPRRSSARPSAAGE